MSIKRLAIIAGLALMAGTAQVAQAQTQPWGGQINFGFPVPLGDLDTAAGTSYGWGAGLRYAPSVANWAIRLDVENQRFNIDNQDLLSNAAWDGDDGNVRIWDFQLNAEFGSRNDAPFRIYGLAGFGYGQVYANVTNGVLYSGCYWDPWWGYVCGTTGANEILAEKDKWDFSARAGAGMSYRTSRRGPTLFAEAKYGLIFTGGDARPTGSETSSNTISIPIVFGVKF